MVFIPQFYRPYPQKVPGTFCRFAPKLGQSELQALELLLGSAETQVIEIITTDLLALETSQIDRYC